MWFREGGVLVGCAVFFLFILNSTRWMGSLFSFFFLLARRGKKKLTLSQIFKHIHDAIY